jgi:hypothetical protein
MGAWSLMESKEVRFHHMTMIDNRVGFGATLGIPDETSSLVMINDNKIYGETEVTDCPSDGSYCETFDK